MKNGLIALLLIVPMVFSSCLGSTESEPDPLAPGVAIYSGGETRHKLALLPTDVALRLAIILAEADKQGLPEEEWLNVTNSNNVPLTDLLLSRYAIYRHEGTKYTIQFPEEEVNDYFGSYSGRVIVETNGQLLGDDTAMWTVTQEDLRVNVNTGFSLVPYSYDNGGETTITENGSFYRIIVGRFNLTTSNWNLLNDWNADYDLTPGTSSLAYSDCNGAQFRLYGGGRDKEVSWDMSNVMYKGVEVSAAYTDYIYGQLQSGTIEASLLGNYDVETYPSPNVRVIWSNDGKSYQIYYNGLVSQ